MPSHDAKSSKTSQVRLGSKKTRKKTPKNTNESVPKGNEVCEVSPMEEDPPKQLGALVMVSPNEVEAPESTFADPLSLNSEVILDLRRDRDDDLKSRGSKRPSVFLLERPNKPTLTVPLSAEGDVIVASALCDAMKEMEEGRINGDEWKSHHKWVAQWDMVRFGRSSSSLQFSPFSSTSYEMKRSKVKASCSPEVPVLTRKTDFPILTKKMSDSPVLTRKTTAISKSHSNFDIVMPGKEPSKGLQSSRTIEKDSDRGTFKITNYLLNMIIKTRKSAQESTGIKRGSECKQKEESPRKKRQTQKSNVQCSESKHTKSPTPNEKIAQNKSDRKLTVRQQEPNLTEKRVLRSSSHSVNCQTVSIAPIKSPVHSVEYDSDSSVISLVIDTCDLNNVLESQPTRKGSTKSSSSVYNSAESFAGAGLLDADTSAPKEDSSLNSSILSNESVSSPGDESVNQQNSSKDSICSATPNEDEVLQLIEDSSPATSPSGQDSQNAALLEADVTQSPCQVTHSHTDCPVSAFPQNEASLPAVSAESQAPLFAASPQIPDSSPNVSPKHQDPLCAASPRSQNSSTAASLYRMTPSPAASFQRTTPSPAASLQGLTPSPYVPHQRITPSPTASFQRITPSPAASHQRITPSPTASLQRISPSPAASLQGITQSPAASLQGIIPSSFASLQRITPSSAASHCRTTPSLAASLQRQTLVLPVSPQGPDSLPPVSPKNQDLLHATSSQSQNSSPADLLQRTTPTASLPAASAESQAPLFAALPQIPHSSPTVSPKHQDLLCATPRSQNSSPAASRNRTSPSPAASLHRTTPSPAALLQRKTPLLPVSLHGQDSLHVVSPKNQDILCATSSQRQDSLPAVSLHRITPSPAASSQRQTPVLPASLQGQDSSPSALPKNQDLLRTAIPRSQALSPAASFQSPTPLLAASPQNQAPWLSGGRSPFHNQAQLPASAIPMNQPAGVFPNVTQPPFNPGHSSCVQPGNFNNSFTCKNCNTQQIVSISAPLCYHYGFSFYPHYPFFHCMGFMPATPSVPHVHPCFYPCGLPVGHCCPPASAPVQTTPTQSTDGTSSSSK